MLALLLWSALARAAIVDYGPPQDVLGHWQFDLYDPSGNERGTVATPLNIALPPGAATAALQQQAITLMQTGWSAKTIIGNSTTVIKTGAGTLHGFNINNNASGGVIYLYDNTAGSGTIAATGNAGTPSGGLLSGSGNSGAAFLGPLDITFTNGLTAVTQGSSNNSFTVIWR